MRRRTRPEHLKQKARAIRDTGTKILEALNKRLESTNAALDAEIKLRKKALHSVDRKERREAQEQLAVLEAQRRRK